MTYFEVIREKIMTIQTALDARKQLGRLFLKRMPAKLRQCAMLLKKGDQKHWPAELTQKLQTQIDRLLKSCSNFELEEPVKLLTQIQSFFNESLDSALTPDSAEVLTLINALIIMASRQDRLDIVQEKPDLADTVRQTADASAQDYSDQEPLDKANIELLEKLLPTVDRPVLLMLAPSAQSTLVEALQLFGYRCKLLKQLDELSATCEIEQPLGIIMPLPHNPDESQFLKKIAQNCSVPFIFYATMDTLENRLMSVRSGGKGFVISPLDPQEIIIQLDRISTPLHDDPLRILVVEDSRSQGVFCVRTLKKVGMEPRWVEQPSELMSAIQEFQPELILMDMQLPDCNGIELAQILQQHPDTSNIPVIYLSAEDDEQKRQQALATAGEGFLPKPVQAEPLVNAVRHRAMRYRLTKELQESDQLTGLINRNSFRKEIEASISKSHRDAVGFCIVLVEIKGLDALRKGKGEAAAERLTLAMANLLRQRVRCSDQVARIQDGRFGILFFDCHIADAENVMQAIVGLWERLMQTMVMSAETSFIWSTTEFAGKNGQDIYTETLKTLLQQTNDADS